MDKRIIVFLIVDLILFLALAGVKTVFFARAAKRRSFLRWLYFSRFDIINSPTISVQKSRETQNRLSGLLLAFIFVSAIAFLYIAKMI